MAWLKWISDEDLKKEVSQLLSVAKEAHTTAKKKFGKNVIDPFSALFEISGFEIDYNLWIKNETARQAQKTLQNQIGNFHQIILGYPKGWDNLGIGNVIDLVSEDKKIVAEIKNKYNTVSGGNLSGVYNALDDLVSPKSSIYKGYTAYFVTIIPKKAIRYDKPFSPSDKGKGQKCPSNDKIREIDGASFYDLVTGCDNALESLFDVLPDVISECTDGKYRVKDIEKLKYFFKLAFG